jgi:hypothetical protein
MTKLKNLNFDKQSQMLLYGLIQLILVVHVFLNILSQFFEKNPNFLKTRTMQYNSILLINYSFSKIVYNQLKIRLIIKIIMVIVSS